jgi:hypothetical protein
VRQGRAVSVVGQRTNNAFLGTPGFRVVRCRRMRAQQANNYGTDVLEFVRQCMITPTDLPAG